MACRAGSATAARKPRSGKLAWIQLQANPSTIHLPPGKGAPILGGQVLDMMRHRPL